MRLEGKKIIVTGGARGIAASVVRAYVKEGATVASFDVLDDLGHQVATEVSAQGPGKAVFYHCNVASRADVEAAITKAVADMGGLDVVAHIAGVERTANAEDITDEQWKLIMDVNVTGTFLINQLTFPALKEKGGAIINFGSDAGLSPYPGGGHYSASKGAVMAWTRTISKEWGKYNIRANSVVPAIWTPMYDEHRAVLSKEELAMHEAAMASIISLGGKLGDPDTDLAPVMVFLASDDSKFISGQIISVNGGGNSVR